MLRLKRFVSITTLAAVALLGNRQAEAAREATLYYVKDFDGPLTCGGSDLSYAYHTIDYIRDKLVDWSYDEAFAWGDRYVDFVDFADVDIRSNGKDHKESMGIDSADVGMIYTHGKYRCSGGQYYGSIEMGDSAFNCWTQYSDSAPANDSWWGDTDLNVMIVDASHSTQKCVLDSGDLFHVDGNFVMLLGFHGTAYDSTDHLHNFWDFVDDSRSDSLGDNWVDELTRRPLGVDNDECAVAVVYEDTEAQADSSIHDMSWFRWNTPGSHSKLYYYYIRNCNPLHGNKL